MKLNYLCISHFSGDIEWLSRYKNRCIVYDRSDSELSVSKNYLINIQRSPNVGYNLYDMFTFIIDNYHNLQDVTTFCKSNIVPRHMGIDKFEKMMNNSYFTPLFDTSLHKPHMPVCMFSSDGCWSEINNGGVLIDVNIHPAKYFTVYNELLKFLFVNPVLPNYITFCPGANYVVPREVILKYSRNFYRNLRHFVSHCRLPGEAHLIERALYTIWMCNFDVTDMANTFEVTPKESHYAK